MIRSSVRRIFSGRVWASTIVAQAFAMVCYVVFLLLQSRFLGPEGRGTAAVIVALGFVLVAVADAGYGPAVPFYIGRGEKAQRNIIGNFMLWFVFTFPMTLLVLAVLAETSDLGGTASYVRAHFFEIAGFVASNALFNLVNFSMLGLRDYARFNALAVISQFTMPVFLIAGELFHIDELSPGAVLHAHTIGYLVAVAMIVLTRQRGVPFWGIHLSFSQIRDQLRTAPRVMATEIVDLMRPRLDIILLLFFSRDPVIVGVYSVAGLLIQTIGQLPQWLSYFVWPKAAHQDANAASVTIRIAGSAFAVIGVGAALYAAGWSFIPSIFNWVLGPGFEQLYILVLWMMPAAVFRAASANFSIFLAGRGFTLFLPFASISVVLAMIILNAILVPMYGAQGAAIAKSAALFIELGILLIGFMRSTSHSIGDVLSELVDFRDLLARRVRTRMGA